MISEVNLLSKIKRAGLPAPDLNYRYQIYPFKKEAYGIKFKKYDILPAKEDTLLEEILKRADGGDIVVDAGAHTGTYTIVLSKHGCQLVAVEPSPIVSEQLIANLECNDIDAKALNLGLGSESGEMTFYLSSTRARSSFNPEKASGKTGSIIDTVSIDVRTLDSLIADDEVPVPDHVKIDVDGFGPQVLQGATQTLQEHHPVVYWEPPGTGIDGEDPESVEEFLREFGYSITKTDYPVVAE